MTVWVASSSFSCAFNRFAVRVAWDWAVSVMAFTYWLSLSWRSVVSVLIVSLIWEEILSVILVSIPSSNCSVMMWATEERIVMVGWGSLELVMTTNSTLASVSGAAASPGAIHPVARRWLFASIAFFTAPRVGCVTVPVGSIGLDLVDGPVGVTFLLAI